MTAHITIRRGGCSVYKIPATVGRSHFTEINQFGVLERVTTMDLIIPSSAMTRLPGPNTPEENDEYICDKQYQPVSVGGRPMWRWCDGYHRNIRVHVAPNT